MYLDPAWLPGDDLTVPQATYETCARNARTLLDRLKVGKSATCATPRHATPLIQQQEKLNKNLFEQKIAQFVGKGLLILPSCAGCLQHDSESVRSAIVAEPARISSSSPLHWLAPPPMADRFPVVSDVDVSRTAPVRHIQLPTGET
jgi:hypothetical protein